MTTQPDPTGDEQGAKPFTDAEIQAFAQDIARGMHFMLDFMTLPPMSIKGIPVQPIDGVLPLRPERSFHALFLCDEATSLVNEANALVQRADELTAIARNLAGDAERLANRAEQHAQRLEPKQP